VSINLTNNNNVILFSIVYLLNFNKMDMIMAKNDGA